MQSVHSCTCLEIETVFLKGLKLEGEKSTIGCCQWELHICHSRPFRKCCRLKAEVCCNLQPEEMRAADASHLLLCLIHKKSPFLTAVDFLEDPGLYHPEWCAAPGWITKSSQKYFATSLHLKAVGVRILCSFVDLGLCLHQNHAEKSQWS